MCPTWPDYGPRVGVGCLERMGTGRSCTLRLSRSAQNIMIAAGIGGWPLVAMCPTCVREQKNRRQRNV